MLIYNVEKVFKARGIDKPFSFFRSRGFSEFFSSQLKQGKLKGMKLSSLEKLCEVLHCTPHDLLEWHPDKSTSISKDHPLRILDSKSKPDIDIELKSIPLEKLQEIKEFLNREKNEDSTSEEQ